MPRFSDSVEIARPPEDVWRLLAVPERWFEGYRETRSRSDRYPGPGTRNDHIYRTRANEEVRVTVTRRTHRVHWASPPSGPAGSGRAARWCR